jgi:hypothetical protein
MNFMPRLPEPTSRPGVSCQPAGCTNNPSSSPHAISCRASPKQTNPTSTFRWPKAHTSHRMEVGRSPPEQQLWSQPQSNREREEQSGLSLEEEGRNLTAAKSAWGGSWECTRGLLIMGSGDHGADGGPLATGRNRRRLSRKGCQLMS